jgi:fructose-bisphosphate aldolase class II
MTLDTAANLVAGAVRRAGAVASFNVVTLEQAEAVVWGAQTASRSVLLQLSQNAIGFHQGYAPLLAACRELAQASDVPVGIHADHISDEAIAVALIADADRLGVGSIMFDAAHLSFADNCEATARVAARAHDAGLWVEAELGAIGGKGGAHMPGVRTDPKEAAEFVGATGVDGLAVAVGSEHAMTSRDAVLDIPLIRALATAVSVPLVLHGSSGVSDAVLTQAVRAGIRKVNIGTALAAAWTTSLRGELTLHRTEHDVRNYSRAPRSDVSAVVADLCAVVT